MTDMAKRTYLLRNSCDNFKNAHSLRRKDLTFLSTLIDTHLELVDSLGDRESVPFLFEIVEVFAKRYSYLHSSKGITSS